MDGAEGIHNPRKDMRKTIGGATLLLGLLLISSVTVWASSSAPPAQGAKTGLFGQVSAVADPAPGLTVVTLDSTAIGTVDVEISEISLVRVPGQERGSASDIRPGDFLAVLAEERSGQSLLALSVLVKPDAPVSTAHFRGAAIPAAGDQVLLMDGDGNVLVADLILRGGRIDFFEVVTAVLSQDVRTGAISILGAESVDAKLARLETALENASSTRAEQNIQNLSQRLRAGTTGHLTTAQGILDRADPSFTRPLRDALNSALQAHGKRLQSFGAGRPSLKVSGTIQVLGEGIVRVSQRKGPELELRFTAATDIRLFGGPGDSGVLDVGFQIEALYDPQTCRAQSCEARSIDVLFPVLNEGLARHLLRQIRTMELEGTVSPDTQAPRLRLVLASGRTVTLTTTDDTRIRVSEDPAVLSDLAPGDSVKVRYDPETMEALSIDTFDERPGRAFISGVVSSIVTKIRPGLVMPGQTQDGNLAVLTPGGQTVVLSITDNTVIERNGLRMNIFAVRRGDLVRPVSQYTLATRQVQVLVLQAPELAGTVRGTSLTPGGTRYVTVSTDSLNLITMRVGDEAEFQSLAPGQRVRAREFSPASERAPALVQQPPRALRTKGTIIALDAERGIVTLIGRGDETIQLLVPQKPGIVTLNGKPASTDALGVGDEVRVAFYKPNKVVVSMVVTATPGPSG